MKNELLYLCSTIKFKIVKQKIYFNEVKRQSENKIDVPFNEEILFSK